MQDSEHTEKSIIKVIAVYEPHIRLNIMYESKIVNQIFIYILV